VVRPRDPAAFNGTVVLNWQNVSAGYEYGSLTAGDEALEGYAWVGVSAQEVGIYGFSRGRRSRSASGDVRPLRDQDPERYGLLQHPGDLGSFEMFSQAARAVGPARRSDVDPMGGLEVQRVIAAGGSQSAMRLTEYPPLFGGSQPFTADKLLALYPSREAFVRRWTDAVDALVTTGALRPEDAGVMKARAETEAARIPTPDGSSGALGGHGQGGRPGPDP